MIAFKFSDQNILTLFVIVTLHHVGNIMPRIRNTTLEDQATTITVMRNFSYNEKAVHVNKEIVVFQSSGIITDNRIGKKI